MKKKIIIGVVLLMFITGCNIINGEKESKGEPVDERVPLMEFGDYKNIVVDNIKSINFIKYTEGGSNDEEITDRDRINSIYNNLSNLTVGEETNMACEDNTKVYVFNMKDNNKISIEIECDWIVVGNKRYEIK